MRSSFGLGMLATALMAGGTLMHDSAQAAPVSTAGGIRAAADSLKLVESVQYVWGGQNYCWYDDGWNGPGWYVCSYGPWVSGGWWGGGYGWHHWHGGHPGHYHGGGGHYHGGGGHYHGGGGHYTVVAGTVVAGMAVAGMAVAGMAVAGTAVAGTAVAGMAVAGIIPTSASRKTSFRWHGSTTASNSIASATRAATTPPMWASWRRRCRKSNQARSGATATDIWWSTMTGSG